MSGYFTASWSDFSLAVVGASAALTGLLFVAVSINIERILAIDTLTGRSLSTMILFIVPLVVGTLLLVPEQPRTALGVELMMTGAAAGAGLLRINRPGNRGSQEPWFGWLLVRLVPSVTITIFLVVAGASLLAGVGGGLYWVAPAVIEALLAGLATVWILLIEIRR
jgi:hypothetical protein